MATDSFISSGEKKIAAVMMLKSNRMLKRLAFAGASRYKWNDEVEPPAALCNNSICISHTHFVGSLLFLSILFFFLADSFSCCTAVCHYSAQSPEAFIAIYETLAPKTHRNLLGNLHKKRNSNFKGNDSFFFSFFHSPSLNWNRLEEELKLESVNKWPFQSRLE